MKKYISILILFISAFSYAQRPLLVRDGIKYKGINQVTSADSLLVIDGSGVSNSYILRSDLLSGLDAYEAIFESGTRASNLIAKFGDYDDSNNGTHISLDDALQLMAFNSAIFQFKSNIAGYSGYLTFSGLTNDRNYAFTDKTGYLAQAPDDYNASTNTPTLSDSDTWQKGARYKVTTAGTQDFGSGNITLAVGDIIGNDGGVWYKEVDNNQSGGGGSVGTLQQVTDLGNTTTNDVTIEGEFIVNDNGYGYVNIGGNFTMENDGYGLQMDKPDGEININSPNVKKNGNEITSFAGDYNASTNTPTLSDADTSKKALEYIVSVAGTQDLGSGNITFGVGDVIANNGSIWYKKVDNNQGGGGTNILPLDNTFTGNNNFNGETTFNEVTFNDDSFFNGDTEFSSTVVINGYQMPSSDGTANQALTTDGAGTLSFTTISGGSGIGGTIANEQIAFGTSGGDIQGSDDFKFTGSGSSRSLEVYGRIVAGNTTTGAYSAFGFLDPSGTARTFAQLSTNRTLKIGGGYWDDILFQSGNGNNHAFIEDAFGINTETPSEALEVIGDAQVDAIILTGGVPTLDNSESAMWTATVSGTKDTVSYDEGDVLVTSKNSSGTSKTIIILDFSAI